MVSEAEFISALKLLARSTADVRAALERLLAATNADTSKIADGFSVVAHWAMKIAHLLFQEIDRNPALNAKVTESQKILLENSDVLAYVLVKYGPYLYEIAHNTGLVELLKLSLGF